MKIITGIQAKNSFLNTIVGKNNIICVGSGEILAGNRVV